MAVLRRLLFLLLLPIAAYGQGVRYDNFVLKPLPAGGLQAVSGALVTVCTSAGAGTPCVPKVANIYSDQALTVPIVGTGGAGTTNSDANGNFGFYIASGDYVITITGSGITSSTVKVTLPCPASGTCAFTGIVTFQNANGVLHVGPGAYATVAAALAAAGSTPTTIIIDSTYGGVDCPASAVSNLTFWDQRSKTSFSPCINNVMTVNSDDASVHSMFRAIQTRTNPSWSDTALYGQCFYTGTFPAAQSLQCLTGETDITGAITPNATGTVSASEHSVNLGSQGGTIQNVYVLLANSVMNSANTTNVQTWDIIRAQTLAQLGGNTGTVNSLFGLQLDQQTAGTAKNFGVFAQSPGVFQGANGGTGLLPALNFQNNSFMLIGDVNHAAGSGTAITAGVLGYARQTADAAGDLAIGGDFLASAQNSAAGEIGIRAATTDAGTGASIAQFRSASTTRSAIDGNGAFRPNVAGGAVLCTALLPCGNLILGTAATNAFTITPAATAAARTINLWDFGANGPSTQNYPGITILTSQYTNSTTGMTTVTGGNTLQFPVLANATYTATCHLYYQAAATGGLNIQFTGPAAATTIVYGLNLPVSATTQAGNSVATAFSTSLGAVVTTAATNFDAIVSLSLINGANAGTVVLQAKSSAAVQLQIQAGSFCRVQ